MNYNGIDLKKVLSYLVEGGIVPEDVLPSTDTPFSSEALLSEMSKGSDLSYDPITDELSILCSDGSIMMCPDLSEGISESSKWISDYIPDVFIDIDQGGNLRKGDEAESCFKLFSLGFVLSDYRKDVKELFMNYDFQNMCPKSNIGGKTFKEALQKYQNLNSVRINSIISAASYKLSNYKEKNESFYTGQLSVEEISELSTLSRNIKAIISKYERDEGLNPTEMKKMTKILKLTQIDKRDIEIENLVSSTNVSMLYRISKLTSERIPPVIKSKILTEAEKAAREYIKEFKLSGLEAIDAEQRVRRIVIKESYRAVLKTIKSNEISRYKADKDKYVFKRKS